jgi:hypothetical protein
MTFLLLFSVANPALLHLLWRTPPQDDAVSFWAIAIPVIIIIILIRNLLN